MFSKKCSRKFLKICILRNFHGWLIDRHQGNEVINPTKHKLGQIRLRD